MSKLSHHKGVLKAKGFTLIELMVTVAMLAILASIALPSYQIYINRNAEYQTQAKMKQLEIELNRWRASALTYKGYKPSKISNDGSTTYAYDENDNQTIYVPSGSDHTDYKYKIVLASVSGSNSSSLISSDTTISQATMAIGRNWAMLAMPNTDKLPKAKKILLNSSGVQCKTKNDDNTVTITSSNCGNYSEKW